MTEIRKCEKCGERAEFEARKRTLGAWPEFLCSADAIRYEENDSYNVRPLRTEEQERDFREWRAAGIGWN